MKYTLILLLIVFGNVYCQTTKKYNVVKHETDSISHIDAATTDVFEIINLKSNDILYLDGVSKMNKKVYVIIDPHREERFIFYRQNISGFSQTIETAFPHSDYIRVIQKTLFVFKYGWSGNNICWNLIDCSSDPFKLENIYSKFYGISHQEKLRTIKVESETSSKINAKITDIYEILNLKSSDTISITGACPLYHKILLLIDTKGIERSIFYIGLQHRTINTLPSIIKEQTLFTFEYMGSGMWMLMDIYTNKDMHIYPIPNLIEALDSL